MSRAKLVESLGGSLSKNVDGQLLTLSYKKETDEIIVEDRKLGLRYPTTVGARHHTPRRHARCSSPSPNNKRHCTAPVAGSDSIVRYDVANATRVGAPVVASSELAQLIGAPFTKGSVGPELINGRAAMVGILLCAPTTQSNPHHTMRHTLSHRPRRV